MYNVTVVYVLYYITCICYKKVIQLAFSSTVYRSCYIVIRVIHVIHVMYGNELRCSNIKGMYGILHVKTV